MPALLNIPNVLSLIRFLGSFALVGLGLAGLEKAFFWWMLVLLATDWIDGKLAIAWDQRTAFGARLDSVADVTMYIALVFGLFWLHPRILQEEWLWFASAGVSYAAACGYGKFKFGRIPTYHTRSAKTSWFLVTVAVIGLFGWNWVWGIRLAALGVVVANLESLAITRVLRELQTDVISLRRARQLSTQTSTQGARVPPG